MPVPVLALLLAALLLAALLLAALLLAALLLAALLLPLVLVLPAAVELVVSVPEEPPALLVEGAPPAPLVVAPGPWAALPPSPPTPSLLPSPSAALAHPCAALPIANATITKPKPIVFTRASRAGLSSISEMIAIVHFLCGEKLLETRSDPKITSTGEPRWRALPASRSRDTVRLSHEKELR
jgi:hypothetical protein